MVNSKPSVFLFIGNDIYLKNRALEELSSSLLDRSSKELDYKVFYGGDLDIAEVLDHANTIPFLASKKLIVIKDAEKISREEASRLITYIKNPISSTCLILESADDSFLSGENDVAGYVNVRRFDNLSDNELSAWIKRLISKKSGSKTISTDAVESIKELQGQDLLSLDQELEKLIAFVGEKGEISSDDVGEVVGRTLTVSAFDLADAIETKKIDDALSIIADLILSGKKHYEIIGLLCWHLKRVMKAVMLREKGESDFRIANALRISKRYADDFFGQLAALDLGKVRLRMQILLEADLDLKRTKYDPALVLEFAVIRMCLI